MIADYDAVKPIFDAVSYTPIGWGKPINERLAEHPDGKKWLRRIAMSGWEIIRDNFEDDHCRSFMLWMAFQTVVRRNGRCRAGRLFARLRPPALELVRAEGRIGGVLGRARAADRSARRRHPHRQARARADRRERPLHRRRMRRRQHLSRRQGRAVDHSHQASRGHGAAGGLGRGFRRRRADVAGRPTLFVTHYATTEPMRFAVDGGVREPMAVGTMSTATRALRMGYDYARGEVNVEDPVLLAVPDARGPAARRRASTP